MADILDSFTSGVAVTSVDDAHPLVQSAVLVHSAMDDGEPVYSLATVVRLRSTFEVAPGGDLATGRYRR